MKTVKIFGKTIPIWILALALTAGIGSAALLTYYGRIVTIVDVHQSIKLWDKGNWLQCTGPLGGGCTVNDVILETSPGGERFCFKHKLINQMSIEGTVLFDTSSPEEGITAIIYTVPTKTTLILENKDSNWNAITDTTTATLTFDTIGNNGKFNYILEVTDLVLNTEYALIYYTDEDPRFQKWGGKDGIIIATFTTGAGGDYSSGSQSVDLGMNLPSLPDWNINPVPNYCNNANGFDSYAHCKGAKIWIVPTSDLTDGDELPLKSWNPSKYLFETDLITYFDCDLEVEDFLVDTLGDSKKVVTNNLLTIPSGEIQELLVCYTFAENIMQGYYTIITNIVPA